MPCHLCTGATVPGCSLMSSPLSVLQTSNTFHRCVKRGLNMWRGKVCQGYSAVVWQSQEWKSQKSGSESFSLMLHPTPSLGHTGLNGSKKHQSLAHSQNSEYLCPLGNGTTFLATFLRYEDFNPLQWLEESFCASYFSAWLFLLPKSFLSFLGFMGFYEWQELRII